MKNSTKITEVLINQRSKLLGRVTMWALPVPVLTKIFGSHNWAVGLLLGITLGLIDQWIMLLGVRTVQPYYVQPKKGIIRFKIFTLFRLINVIVGVFLVLRLKDCTGGLVVGFLLIHILFIIILISLTRTKAE